MTVFTRDGKTGSTSGHNSEVLHQVLPTKTQLMRDHVFTTNREGLGTSL